MRKTDDEFMRDLVTAGAPDDSDPAVVEAAALEIAAASSRGAPSEDVVKRIAKKYPQLGMSSSGRGKKVAPSPIITARDIMHRSVTSVDKSASLQDVAEVMRDLEIGSLPVHDDNQQLLGMITDRDIVVHAVAVGRDPAKVTAGQFSSEVPWVAADAAIEVIQTAMEKQLHAARRGVVVVDDGHRAIGLIGEKDLVAHLSPGELAQFGIQSGNSPDSSDDRHRV